MEYAYDNRFSPGASCATIPETALAVYSARWIDHGIDVDVLPDRQGFAYNKPGDRDHLIDYLEHHQVHAGPFDPDEVRDTTIYVIEDGYFKLAYRRAGGYIYVDAWIS